MKTTAPYGTWKSPITTDAILEKSVGLGQGTFDGDDLLWIEARPEESGRCVIVRRTPDGATADLTPPPFNSRTRVHEYGGGSMTVGNGVILFSNFADQRLHRIEADGSIRPLTPEVAIRFADGVIDAKRNRAILVREDHRGDGEAVNTIVAVDLDEGGEGEVLAEGCDFFSSPRLSPDGNRLCWLSWDHPRMPWDGTELMLADLDGDGRPIDARVVAGGPDESVFQPEWSPAGELVFATDKSGWWNLCRLNGEEVEPLCPRDAEFGRPGWGFRMSVYDFLSPTKIVTTYTESDGSKLATLDLETKELTPIDLPYTVIGSVRAGAGKIAIGAASEREPAALVLVDPEDGGIEVVRKTSEMTVDEGYVSVPEAIEFPTENGLTAHAYYYAPANAEYEAPEGELPPLLVKSHGGPTSATEPAFSPATLFWTSRGIGVLDVNYGGSTGYGREYRERLKDNWGIVDVDDCANGALHMVSLGKADRERLAIRGGSAGGYTTLAALAFRDVFRAGASHYGVSDLSALAEETHKFESRYLDGLVGPYPEKKDVYEARSPIHHVDGLDCPVIFFQGLEDRVVPPNQAEMMVDALRAKGIPVAYVPFEGEQHGFRIAENIKRALEAELWFYGHIFGFEPEDEIEPVDLG